MKHTTEIHRINELLKLNEEKSAFLDDSVSHNPVEHYYSASIFEREQAAIFRQLPQPLVHSSELKEPGAFLRRTLAGLPLLITRDADGHVHVFLNVCRHRGTRLVDEQSGCKHRFTCPYHAWTWDNRGELIGVPHQKLGFPDLDRAQHGLKRLGCSEFGGWLWVNPAGEEAPDIPAFLQDYAPDFSWFGGESLQLLHVEEQTREVNWKLLVEGGIEAYHFRVAHRNTIAPYFFDNLSSYESSGPHLRSILAKRSMANLRTQAEADWQLRDHAQVVYTLFPTTQLLVQSDHIGWVHFEPLSASSTRMRLCTLVPANRVETDKDLAHWAKNHAITVKTLSEDFEIGESIQQGLRSGANEALNFGRFEGALAVFNQQINDRLSPE